MEFGFRIGLDPVPKPTNSLTFSKLIYLFIYNTHNKSDPVSKAHKPHKALNNPAHSRYRINDSYMYFLSKSFLR